MRQDDVMHVVVGLSGGVDSAVTAALLKEQGYRVTAVHMTNWHEPNDSPYCYAKQDLEDAFAVSKQLGIQFESVDLSEPYHDEVFSKCLQMLAQGYTPNPDVLCNRHIKFDAFLDVAKQLGADLLATGHYVAKKVSSGGEQTLWQAADLNKDQSYFLCWLNQNQLASSMFPLAAFTKPEIRTKALDLGLINATKRDSVGLCFIGKRKFADFISDFMLDKPGPIKTIDGKSVGKHRGLMYYTIGQRQGINLGGLKGYSELPWYVVGKQLESRTLVVAQGQDHPALWQQSLHIQSMHWIGSLPKNCDNLQVKIRYRQEPVSCSLHPLKNEYRLLFNEPQRAITPGQIAAIYDQGQCLGGGMISLPECS
jgi:tRNA-uridine 2-sulfurtransferase